MGRLRDAPRRTQGAPLPARLTRLLAALLAGAGVPVPPSPLTPSALAAQEEEAPLVPPGARVRVTTVDVAREALIGALQRLDPASLTVLPELGAASTVPLQDVARFEVSRGVRSWTTAGALAGGALAVGLVLLVDDTEDGQANRYDPLGVSLPIGAVIGGLLGSRVLTERWEEVDPLRIAPFVNPGPVPKSPVPRFFPFTGSRRFP